MYMPTPLNVFAYLFAVVGIVAILAVIYYTYLYYSQRKAQQVEAAWPPPNFMRYIGARCPTGFEYLGSRDNQDICQNIYDVRTNPQDPNCYTSKEDRTKQFTELKNWPLRKSEVRHLLKDRCEYVRNCGPNQGQYATWFGIADLC